MSHLRATGKIEDRLVAGPQEPGVVILNHGDPAYGSHGDDPRTLPMPEALFLRVLAYSLFAERICVPARYIVAWEPTYTGVMLARRLLEEGILRPERRAEVGSSEELAEILDLGDAARVRGNHLDRVATATRSFYSRDLAKRYHEVLTDDLAPGGPLRRRLAKGRSKEAALDLERALDQALAAYEPLEAGTPEEFTMTVARFAPRVEGRVRQWAMAKYYITPAEFDTLNTREVPFSAARLLAGGELIPPSVRPMDTPAPVSEAQQRLTMNLRANDLSYLADVYCEAVLRVRDKLPEARETFRKVRGQVDLVPLTDELSQLMDEELRRQQGRRRLSGLRYTLITSLTTGSGGSAAGFPFGPIAAAVTGTVTAVVSAVGQRTAEGWLDRKRRPWVLAIDRVTDAFTRARARSKQGR